MERKIFIWLSVALLGACGPTVSTLTLNSDPQGAVVTQPSTGDRWITPTVVTYPSTATPLVNRCYDMQPLTVTWASGVKADYTPRLCRGLNSYSDVVKRPPGPGLQKDQAAAWEMARQSQVQVVQQSAPSNDQAWAGLGYAAGCALAGGCTAPAPTVTCRSNVWGNNIDTTCR